MLFGRSIRDTKVTTLQHIKNGPQKQSYQQIPNDISLRNTSFIQGDEVRVQDPITRKWNTHAVVTGISDTGRTLDMITEEGQCIRRNRKFVKTRCAPLQN